MDVDTSTIVLDNYISSVRKAMELVEDNFAEQAKQLESLGRFTANITKKFGNHYNW